MKMVIDKDWLKKKIMADDYEEPSGCIACGRIAGCCEKYPNCPGNPEWQSDQTEHLSHSQNRGGGTS